MESKFPPQYNPAGVELGLYEFWEKNGYFSPDIHRNGRGVYVIVIPPPNITGVLHMGHALNNTIQDVLIRWKRMSGFSTLWVPGTDHAGIATQNVVEKMLREKNLDRKILGREKFIEEVWKWKEKYGSTIIFQLKKLGASCDWSRERFTMDEKLSRAVKEAFIHLYNKGLIYKGKRIIHWCCRCGTALSDEEVNYRDENAFLYYIKYPMAEDGTIEVATTRPETMLGDTAVAVSPADGRYKNYIGRQVILPFVDRSIPIISDERVEPEFGTGAVKVTPSHDPVDFDIGTRHNLPFITVMDEAGIMNENAGKFKGMDRFLCREKIIKELEDMGLLSKKEPYLTRIGTCYRCDTVIEPYLSSQWFVRMQPLTKPAIEVAERDILKFYPERWKKVYLNWLYNIRDWCISRQIWWGHRIPVWYCRKCQEKHQEKGIFVSAGTPTSCPVCGSLDIWQDPDVLDTWFSSWLWPFSVFGWPEETEDLKIYYPTDTLVTAQEILFFWVARMVMAGYEFMGKHPFKNIVIHGTVRDRTGRKMSKSLGNIIDPLDIIEKYGADSLRFSLISMTAAGQDVFLSPTFYIKGRNFTNKLWNASRFIATSVEKYEVKIELPKTFECLQFPERWILLSFNTLIQQVNNSLEEFRLNEAINLLYDFFWHTFCDWYLEISKVYQQQDEAYFKEKVIPVLFYIHLSLMKMLHPFIPFITEKLWQVFSEYCIMETESIMISKWPEIIEIEEVDGIMEKMEDIMEIITSIRNLKTRFGIPVVKPVNCYFDMIPDEMSIRIISRLAGIGNIAPFPEGEQKNLLIKNLRNGRIGISFEGIIDIQREMNKLRKERDKLKGHLEKIERKIQSPEFALKAPEEVQQKEKEKKRELEEALKNLARDIEFIEKQ
ncbi:MAG: valine--tRNA ligase [Candidatus Ratteibacteria bacterium]|nr:valine--tRNA ligase [Candidatus Ratteibacteria bacterium]